MINVKIVKDNSVTATALIERTVPGLHEFILNKLVELPNLLSNASVLDIGCGTGAWINRLSSAGFTDLHAIDRDVEQFGSISAKCSQANLDYDDLGLGTLEYNLITSIELIEHLENPGRLFFHINKHLSDDGYCLITTPNIHSLHARIKFMLTGRMPAFDDKSDPTHIYPVLHTSLQRILPRYGLRIVQTWSYPSCGTLIFRWPIRFLSSVLSVFLPDDSPGDIVCILLRRQLKG